MFVLVLLALIPVIFMIALGYGLKHSAFRDSAFWAQAERLCYYVLLPALFFHSLVVADLSALPVGTIGVVLIGTVVSVAALVVVCRPLLGGEGARFTSIFQGSIRFNNYIGIALVAALFGVEGVALAAVCNAAMVPVVNFLCVLVFARFGSARLTWHGVIKQLLTNPLLVSCSAGIVCQIIGLRLPAGLEPALKALGSASMPLGLLCVGAALTFSAARLWMLPLPMASSVKFILMPLVAYALILLTGLEGAAATVALLFTTLPTASSSYIMARQLGGDAPLMAGITALQTVLSALAIPAVFALALF